MLPFAIPLIIGTPNLVDNVDDVSPRGLDYDARLELLV